MKINYYLKGMGVGIVVTTLILSISFQNRRELSDSEIKDKAKELGMVEAYEEGVLSDLREETEETASGEKPDTEIAEKEDGVDAEADEESFSEETANIEDTDVADAMEVDAEALEAVSGNDMISGNYVVSEEGAYMMVTVWEGEYASAVAARLEALGLIEDAKSFARYLIDTGHQYFVRYGVHKIPVGVDDETVAKILISNS